MFLEISHHFPTMPKKRDYFAQMNEKISRTCASSDFDYSGLVVDQVVVGYETS
jgi:hypothetical protein